MEDDECAVCGLPVSEDMPGGQYQFLGMLVWVHHICGNGDADDEELDDDRKDVIKEIRRRQGVKESRWISRKN